MGYNLLIDGVYGGYNPLTNFLVTSWDIQVDQWLCLSPRIYHALVLLGNGLIGALVLVTATVRNDGIPNKTTWVSYIPVI